jgi:hypothetical protein
VSIAAPTCSVHMVPADIHDLVSSAIAGGALFGGGIVRSDGAVPLWRITTEVPPASLELFRTLSDEAVVTSDVIGMRPGWVCWVVAYQVRDVQHRLFLPLFGAEVGDFTRRVRRSSARLLFDAAGAKTMLEVRIPLSAQVRGACREHWRASVDDSFFAKSLLLSAASLLVPGALAPADGVNVAREISVTAVVPGDFRLGSAGEAAATLWRALDRRDSRPD